MENDVMVWFDQVMPGKMVNAFRWPTAQQDSGLMGATKQSLGPVSVAFRPFLQRGQYLGVWNPK